MLKYQGIHLQYSISFLKVIQNHHCVLFLNFPHFRKLFNFEKVGLNDNETCSVREISHFGDDGSLAVCAQIMCKGRTGTVAHYGNMVCAKHDHIHSNWRVFQFDGKRS